MPSNLPVPVTPPARSLPKPVVPPSALPPPAAVSAHQAAHEAQPQQTVLSLALAKTRGNLDVKAPATHEPKALPAPTAPATHGPKALPAPTAPSIPPPIHPPVASHVPAIHRPSPEHEDPNHPAWPTFSFPDARLPDPPQIEAAARYLQRPHVAGRPAYTPAAQPTDALAPPPITPTVNGDRDPPPPMQLLSYQ